LKSRGEHKGSKRGEFEAVYENTNFLAIIVYRSLWIGIASGSLASWRVALEELGYTKRREGLFRGNAIFSRHDRMLQV
jgi:hypothetical protein